MKLHEMNLDQLRAISYEVRAQRDKLDRQAAELEAVIMLRKAEAEAAQASTVAPSE